MEIKAFKGLVDPRRNSGNLVYKLQDLLTMSILAIISGMNTWVEIADWIHEELEWFNDYFKTSYAKSPCEDTFSRLFSVLEIESFEACIQEFLKNLKCEISGQIAIDGKTSRGSKHSGYNAIHTINAYAVESGLCLSSNACSGKGQEIKGIKELLDEIDISNLMVSIDAIGCQTSICEKIINKQADYLIAVKGNQGNLYDALIDDFKQINSDKIQHIKGDLDKRGVDVHESTYYFLSNNLPADIKEKWWHIKHIIKEEKMINNELISSRYFISSSADIAYLASVIKNHWRVENSLHWVLDVHFKEDANKSHIENSAHNFGILRKIAFNSIQLIKKPKYTIRKTKLMFDKNDTFRKEALSIIGFKCG
jgi:predicted transposase YbfD/YdcC